MLSSACSRALAACVFLSSPLCIALAQGPPPDYATFRRTQVAEYLPDASKLLRVWMVYVDQGDGLLIQLPMFCSYGPTKTQRLDIAIDGGSNPVSEAYRFQEFVRALYPTSLPTIEYAVITHHDSDHVAGLTDLLRNSAIRVEQIFHNGLASYRPGARDFPASGEPDFAAVVDCKDHEMTRGMARLEIATGCLESSYLINDLAMLRQSFAAQEFQGVYDSLARAICSRQIPDDVQAFDRAHQGSPFIKEREATLGRGANLDGLSFDVLWPPKDCRRYGDWGETINGNSIVFKLTYGDFEMLFTGDMNEMSQAAMLEDFATAGRVAELKCDVMKVPHHGSTHGFEDFFDAVSPVLGVASMGEQGFRSKGVSGRGAWQHPSTDIIGWLGGSHRVYCTEIEERRFRWDELTSKSKVDAMKEFSHVLIETDGTRFRIVEIDADRLDLISQPPTVKQTRRGDGTRWISAQ